MAPYAAKKTHIKPLNQENTYMESTQQPFDRFISIKEVMHISSISQSQIYALIKLGKFPKPYDLSEKRATRCSRWSFLEVHQWLAEKISAQKAA